MSSTATNLILCVHGHQPVGNFGWVFGEAFEKSYRPFFEVIERHPRLKWAVHLSGPLIEYIDREHPDLIKKMAAMVKRGQIEIMGGGIAEPILALLPEEDAKAQLTRMTKQLDRLRLGPVRGAWLAERVWEPNLPSIYHATGIEYTVVDDHHLRLSGLGDASDFGYWITENNGATVALFPSSKALRYLVPFKPVEEVVAHLQSLRGAPGRAVVLGDDLEKFGLWPGTHRWVYEEGWLERFCQALEREESWLKTYTFSQWMGAYPPLGRTYVPTASYEEMLQWSNGNFRNFLTKYPESNTMHKKMLWVSHRFHKHAQSKNRMVQQAREHLYRGQSNDAYWHGVFGGIYLNHLRSSVYRELLTAERLLDQVEMGSRTWTRAYAADFDGDLQPEILLQSSRMNILVDPQEGGAIVEWDDKVRAVNVLNTLTRRREPYHAKLLEREAVLAGQSAGSTPQTIHDGLKVKETGLENHLVFDRSRRAAAMDHLWTYGAGDPQTFSKGLLEEQADCRGPYLWRLDRRANKLILHRDFQVNFEGRTVPLRITKSMVVDRKQPVLDVEYTLLNLGSAPIRLRFGSEWNLAVKDPHFNRIGILTDSLRWALTDAHADLKIEMASSRPTGAWYFPIETVSDSEAGMERTYQQLNVTLFWDLELSARKSWQVHLSQGLRSGGVHAEV